MPDDVDLSATPKINGASTETKPVAIPDPRASADTSGTEETPRASPVSSRSSFSFPASVTNMWSGLIRTFSADSGTFPTQQSTTTTTTSPSSASNSIASSMYTLPPLDPVVLLGYKDSTEPEARLMSGALAEEIRALIPDRLKLVDDWDLIFSLAQDGASLGTMYSRAKEYKGTRSGFVFVVRDSYGGTFGAYLSEYPRPAPSYFGNGECFLWRAILLHEHDLNPSSSLPPPPSSDTTDLHSRSTTVSVPGAQDSDATRLRFKAFPYSGVNDFLMNCETSFFSIGAGGGHYGLWVDSSLLRGHSSRCETFGNEPLSEQGGGKFSIIGAELWAIGKESRRSSG